MWLLDTMQQQCEAEARADHHRQPFHNFPSAQSHRTYMVTVGVRPRVSVKGARTPTVGANMLAAADGDLHLRQHVPVGLCAVDEVAGGEEFHHGTSTCVRGR